MLGSQMEKNEYVNEHDLLNSIYFETKILNC